MVVKAPRVKCCSKRAVKLKKASYAKAKKAADEGSKGAVKKAPARKAAPKKAAAKKAKPCTVCGKK